MRFGHVWFGMAGKVWNGEANRCSIGNVLVWNGRQGEAVYVKERHGAFGQGLVVAGEAMQGKEW